MRTLSAKSQNTTTIRRAGKLTASAAVAGTMLLPGVAAASTDQVCSGRSIRFVSGQTASSDVLSFGQMLPAGVYDAMLVTADSYPERASSDPGGQQTEIVEVAGIVSRDLADGVEMTNDITYGRFTASAPFSSVTAYHRASTPGPNSVWVSTFCLTPVVVPPTTPSTAPTTTVPTTTAPSTTAPSTTAPSTTAPSTTAPSTTAPSTTTPSTTTPSTAAPSTTAPSTANPSTTSTSVGSILGPSTTVPTGADSGDPFGVSEPIPAGPVLPDVNQPMGTPQPLRDPGAVPTRADVPSQGTLPLTGTGLGVAFVALALLGVGVVTTAGSKSLDAAGNAE